MRLVPRASGTIFDPGRIDEWQKAFDSNMKLLFAFFGIKFNERDAWRKLAVALAFRHVPAFYEQRRVGRPNRSGIDPIEVYGAIEEERKRYTGGRKPSIAELHKNGKLPKFETVTAKTLSNLHKIGREMLE